MLGAYKAPARSSPATLFRGNRAGRWSVRRVPSTGTADAATAQQVLHAAERDAVPGRQHTLGRTRQEVSDDRLDILASQPIAEAPVRTAGTCRWIRGGQAVVRLEYGSADSAEVIMYVWSVRVVGDQLHPEIALGALRERKAAQAADRLMAGELWEDSGLVFTTSVGTMPDQRNIRREFRRIIKAAGLGDAWVPRELRHTFVSIMSFASQDPATLAAAAVPGCQAA